MLIIGSWGADKNKYDVVERWGDGRLANEFTEHFSKYAPAVNVTERVNLVDIIEDQRRTDPNSGAFSQEDVVQQGEFKQSGVVIIGVLDENEKTLTVKMVDREDAVILAVSVIDL